MEEKVQEIILNIISNVIVEEMYTVNLCAFQTYNSTLCGCYIIQCNKFPVVLKVPWISTECNPSIIIPTVILVWGAKCRNSMVANSFCYRKPPEYLTVLVKMKQVIHVDLILDWVQPKTCPFPTRDLIWVNSKVANQLCQPIFFSFRI